MQVFTLDQIPSLKHFDFCSLLTYKSVRHQEGQMTQRQSLGLGSVSEISSTSV